MHSLTVLKAEFTDVPSFNKKLGEHAIYLHSQLVLQYVCLGPVIQTGCLQSVISTGYRHSSGIIWARQASEQNGKTLKDCT